MEIAEPRTSPPFVWIGPTTLFVVPVTGEIWMSEDVLPAPEIVDPHKAPALSKSMPVMPAPEIALPSVVALFTSVGSMTRMSPRVEPDPLPFAP